MARAAGMVCGGEPGGIDPRAVGARRQQQPDHGFVTAPGGEHQRGLAGGVRRVHRCAVVQRLSRRLQRSGADSGQQALAGGRGVPSRPGLPASALRPAGARGDGDAARDGSGVRAGADAGAAFRRLLAGPAPWFQDAPRCLPSCGRARPPRRARPHDLSAVLGRARHGLSWMQCRTGLVRAHLVSGRDLGVDRGGGSWVSRGVAPGQGRPPLEPWCAVGAHRSGDCAVDARRSADPGRWGRWPAPRTASGSSPVRVPRACHARTAGTTASPGRAPPRWRRRGCARTCRWRRCAPPGGANRRFRTILAFSQRRMVISSYRFRTS